MKIYIAGPMTGLPDFNYPAFNAAAAALRSAGHLVENPAENPDPVCKSWLGYMRLAIAQLITCDAIYLLCGWEGSKGANLELAIAKGLGLVIHFEPVGQKFSAPALELRVDELMKVADGYADTTRDRDEMERAVRASLVRVTEFPLWIGVDLAKDDAA